MRAILSTLLLFLLMGGLTAVSLLAEPGQESQAPDEPVPASYWWVRYEEITPPGERFPTVITKHEGAFVAPDRRRDIAGGVDASGEIWMMWALIIGERAWERVDASVPQVWTPLPEPPPGLAVDFPPFWSLFTMSEAARETATPTVTIDEYEGTGAHRYDLVLGDLPALRNHIARAIAEVVPGTFADQISDVPVELWISTEDGWPRLLAIRPTREVLPGLQLLFNLRLTDVENPAIVIEEPPAR